MKKHKNSQGFSLIEMAIVIAILGLILTPLFAFITMQQRNDEQREEEALHERALASLALYLRQNGIYPCPADPALGPGDPDFGRAECSAVGARVNSGGVAYGALPVRDLNLPFHAAANIDNWKYIYAVTRDLTAVGSFDGQGDIQIIDPTGADFTATPRQFIIVNPGGDGKGTWNLNGSAGLHPCGTVALDHDNCNTDGDFVEADYSYNNDPLSADHYDDTLMYTLAREESTFWIAEESTSTGTPGINIVNRNQGNVGIGNNPNPPSEKLHVFGGDILVQEDSSGGASVGGNIEAQGNITATQTIRSESNIIADDRITAPVFYYDTP